MARCIPFITHLPSELREPILRKQDAQALAESYLRDQKHLDISAWKLVEANTDKRPAEPIIRSNGNKRQALIRKLRSNRARKFGFNCTYKGMKFPATEHSSRFPKHGVTRKPYNTNADCAVIRHSCFCSRRSDYCTADFFPQPQTSGNCAGTVEAIGPMVSLLSVAAILMFANRLPQLINAYRTASPLKIYYVTLAITIVFGIAIYLAGIFLLLGLAWFFLARAFDREQFPGWLGMQNRTTVMRSASPFSDRQR